MANKSVKLKNKRGDYLYPYTDNIPTGNASVAGKVKVDSAPTSGSSNAISSGAVYSALAGKLGTNETAAKATADASGNNIVNTYLKKTETAAKATADADGNNIASTYLKKTEEGRGGLSLLSAQLRKAFAWTWSQTLTNGQVQIVYNNGGQKVTGAVTCNSFYKYGGNYPVIDGKLYTLNSYAGTLTQFGSDTNYKAAIQNVAIKGNGIYYVGSTTYAKWIDSGGTWTDIGYGFGIKNGALGAFGTQSNTNAAIAWGIIDTGGVWTKIITSGNGYCVGLRDGYAYYATSQGSSGSMVIGRLVQLTTKTDYTLFAGNSSNIYACNGCTCDVYPINSIVNGYTTGPSTTFTFPDEIVQISDSYFLLADGRMYSNQSHVDSNVLALGSGFYLKEDGVYVLSTRALAIDGSFQTMSGNILFSGAGSVQRSTVYTVGNPGTNYMTYKKVNLQEPVAITATSSTTVTSGGVTYTRDQTRDSVFTQPPDDLKKQTPTKWEYLEMISNIGE